MKHFSGEIILMKRRYDLESQLEIISFRPLKR
jgi:hypothetical protein